MLWLFFLQWLQHDPWCLGVSSLLSLLLRQHLQDNLPGWLAFHSALGSIQLPINSDTWVTARVGGAGEGQIVWIIAIGNGSGEWMFSLNTGSGLWGASCVGQLDGLLHALVTHMGSLLSVFMTLYQLGP